MLLHGLSGHARSWDAFAEAMTDRYRVLALDQRGHGESAWAPADRYGVEDMADDLAAFVEAMGLKEFHLLGLSMGGMVTMEYAGRRPPQLARCAIVDIGPELVAAGPAAFRAASAHRMYSTARKRRSPRREPSIPFRRRRIIASASTTA